MACIIGTSVGGYSPSGLFSILLVQYNSRFANTFWVKSNYVKLTSCLLIPPKNF
jgi:hypothetical protein